jgi:hypothetical protein
MWFEKFLNTIARRFPSKRLPPEVLAKLNPDKIYVENVRSLLDVSYSSAVEILEEGLRKGWLLSGFEVRCPDGTVAAIAETERELPPVVTCTGEEDGHPTEIEIPTNSLKTEKFYRLNDSATFAIGQGA